MRLEGDQIAQMEAWDNAPFNKKKWEKTKNCNAWDNFYTDSMVLGNEMTLGMLGPLIDLTVNPKCLYTIPDSACKFSTPFLTLLVFTAYYLA